MTKRTAALRFICYRIAFGFSLFRAGGHKIKEIERGISTSGSKGRRLF